MQLLGSLVFTACLFLSVPVYATLVLLSAPLPHRLRYRIVLWWVDLILWLLKILCRLDYEVEGAEHIPDRPGIVFWKHSSAWETIAQCRIFPIQTWVLKRELMWAPFLGWALALLKPIAIQRGAGRSAVEQVLEQGRRRLGDGLWVAIFPEGTRVTPGTTRRYGISGALLAGKAGRPIVPVAHNAGDFWPRRGLMKRPGTVRVCIGPPIETAGREVPDINAEVQGWIEGRMAQISRHYARLPDAS
ncbi:MAG: lysophospholipid acyltransferase family protein [Gammaproteobacteria bacterium]